MVLQLSHGTIEEVVLVLDELGLADIVAHIGVFIDKSSIVKCCIKH